MASYHCSIKSPLSRGKGKSLIAKAAYNARTQYRDEREEKLTRDYEKHGELLDSFVAYSEKIKAPDWVRNDPERMLNEAVKGLRKNAREGQEIIFGFIDELSPEKNTLMLRDFLREQIFRKTGHVAFVNIHPPSKEGDERNFHAHVLLMPRALGREGFVDTLPSLTPKDYDRIREKWAELGARELRKNGHELEAGRYEWGHLKLRYDANDRRTWNGNNQFDKAKERGDQEWMQQCDREAQKHLGPQRTTMEREHKIRTYNGDFNRDLEEHNWRRQNVVDLQDQINNAKGPPQQYFGMKREIHEAFTKTSDPHAFKKELEDRGLHLARITEDDHRNSHTFKFAAEKRGRYSPLLYFGEYVVVNEWGNAYRLNNRTTGTQANKIKEFMKPLDKESIPALHEIRSKLEAERLKGRDYAATGWHGRPQRSRPEPFPGRITRTAERTAGKVLEFAASAVGFLPDAKVLTPEQKRDGEIAMQEKRRYAQTSDWKRKRDAGEVQGKSVDEEHERRRRDNSRER